jgi:hypothetical protein
MICKGSDWTVRDVENNVCEAHSFGCSKCSYEYLGGIIYREEATFKYKGLTYCNECLADVLNINIKEVSYREYTDTHGNYLGNSMDNDLENILLDCSFVESLGE